VLAAKEYIEDIFSLLIHFSIKKEGKTITIILKKLTSFEMKIESSWSEDSMMENQPPPYIEKTELNF
jgi:hypothetical protein